MAIDQFEANELVTRANVNSRITQANDYFPVSIANGGTGGTTVTEARTNLGVFTTEQIYSNSSGNSGTITLSSSAANYDYLEIETDGKHYTKFYKPNGKSILISYNNHDGSSLTWYAKTMSVNGTSMTVSSHYSGYAKTGVPPSEFGVYNDKSTKIYRVIGYKK